MKEVPAPPGSAQGRGADGATPSAVQRLRLLDLGFLALLGAVCFVLSSAHSDFGPFHHPDEGSKVRQVRTGQYDFYHPHLLLTATRVLGLALGPSREEMSTPEESWRPDDDVALGILRNGRLASALMASIATVLLALAAVWRHGRFAGFLAGGMVALNPGLITRAHYLKEDVALVFGLSVILLGLSWPRRGAGLAPALVTALGCGLTASAKYVGLVPVAGVALAALFLPRCLSRAARLRQAALGAGLALGVFGLLNLEAVLSSASMSAGLGRELAHVSTAHASLVSDRAWLFYLETLWRECSPSALVGSALFAARLVGRRGRVGAWDWLVGCFPVAYFAMMLPSTVHFARYLLPTVVALQWLGGLGLAWAIETTLGRAKPARPSMRPVAFGLLAALALAPGAHSAWSCVRQFGDDGRDRLNDWLEAQPPGLALIADSHANLDAARLAAAGHRVWNQPLRFDAATLEDLRRVGITHVVTCTLSHDRYLVEHRRAYEGEEQYFARQVDGYRRLFREGRVVWRNDQPLPMPPFVNPGLRVFDIRP